MEAARNTSHGLKKSLSKIREDRERSIRSQEARLYRAFYYGKPKTMKQVAVSTGIDRANICRYKAKLEKHNLMEVVYLGVCPITGHDRVAFLTCNPALFPPKEVEQLKIF